MIDLVQADAQDAAELARIQEDSWRAYNPIFSEAYMAENNTFEKHFFYWMDLLTRENDRTYLIKAENESVGYIVMGYSGDDDAAPGTLELTALYLRTACQGKGYAAHVMRRVLTSIKEIGYSRLNLWVLKDNHHAIDFYRHFGFTFDGIEMTLPIHGAILQTRMSVNV